ncbi:Uncharacterised protein [uncultured archaeon]|nr:Uncharacterised protein [uncultured archaeon]
MHRGIAPGQLFYIWLRGIAASGIDRFFEGLDLTLLPGIEIARNPYIVEHIIILLNGGI